MEQINCPICLESVGVARVTLDCGHVHCVACFARWCQTSNKCTCCRREFADVKPLVDKKTSLHSSQIYERIEYIRSQNKNMNYKKYNEIIELSRQPPDVDVRNEICFQFNQLIDMNSWTMARSIQQFYEL